MSTLEHPPASASRTAQQDELTMSVVIPCLNEEENITEVVQRALTVLHREGISGEVVVADNRSEDRSAELATAAGARVVHEPRRGYGSASRRRPRIPQCASRMPVLKKKFRIPLRMGLPT